MAVVARITVGNVHVLSVDADPSVSGGLDAPVGSIATLVDGSAIYRKNSAVATDWLLVVDQYQSIMNSIVFG